MIFRKLATPPVHITMIRSCFEVNGITEKVFEPNEV